jgi:drug/metabolite transporter (DMT)-like permease
MSRQASELGMDPLAFVVWRAGIALLAILAFAAYILATKRHRWIRPLANFNRLPRRRRIALAIGITLSALLNVAIFAAFGRMAIAVVLITFYTFPALVTLAAWPLFGDRLDARRLAALTLSLGGLALVLLAPAISGGSGLVVDPLGVALALFAAGCQTSFILIAGRGFAPMKSADMATWLVTAGAVVGALVLAVLGDVGNLAAPAGEPQLWIWVLAAGIAGAAIPTVWFMGGISRIGPSRTAILMTFEPVVGVTLAGLLLGEQPVPLQLVGGAAVVIAAVVLQTTPARVPRQSETPLA